MSAENPKIFFADADWNATKQLAGQAVKKPAYTPKPRRPRKPKIDEDMSVLGETMANRGLEDIEEKEEVGNSGRTAGHEVGTEGNVELVNSMQALAIAHFLEVSALG